MDFNSIDLTPFNINPNSHKYSVDFHDIEESDQKGLTAEEIKQIEKEGNLKPIDYTLRIVDVNNEVIWEGKKSDFTESIEGELKQKYTLIPEKNK